MSFSFGEEKDCFGLILQKQIIDERNRKISRVSSFHTGHKRNRCRYEHTSVALCIVPRFTNSILIQFINYVKMHARNLVSYWRSVVTTSDRGRLFHIWCGSQHTDLLL